MAPILYWKELIKRSSRLLHFTLRRGQYTVLKLCRGTSTYTYSLTTYHRGQRRQSETSIHPSIHPTLDRNPARSRTIRQDLDWALMPIDAQSLPSISMSVSDIGSRTVNHLLLLLLIIKGCLLWATAGLFSIAHFPQTGSETHPSYHWY